MLKTGPITLEALKVLDSIDRRGSYAAAAEELNKVPSALSYIVQKLEEQMNVTIFQRQGRKAVLTPAGKHLLEHGREVLSAVDNLEEQTRAIASGWESKIRIGFDSMFEAKHGFQVIATFLDEHPELEIDVCEEAMNGGWEALINDQIDLLLGGVAPVPQHKGIRAVALGQFNGVFAVSPAHPLAKLKRDITAADLAEHRTVVVHDSARTAIPWSRGLINQSRHFYVPTIGYKIDAQLAGIGCGFLPRERVQHHLDKGELVALTLEHEPEREDANMYMAWKLVNKGQGLARLRQLFMERETEAMSLTSDDKS